MLTPIDIQNHTLKTAVRGYSKKETDDFIEEVLESYEEIYKENRELKDKLTSLSEGIQYYKNMENTLQKALVLAEKTSSETQEAAKSKADALINEAQAKADSIKKDAQAFAEITKSDANRELEAARSHVRKLVQSYENYRLQFKKLAESQIEMLDNENYSIFAPELSEILEDAPSADEAMKAQETVGMNASEADRIDPVELTEEEKFADTKDLSGVAESLDDTEAETDDDFDDSVDHSDSNSVDEVDDDVESNETESDDDGAEKENDTDDASWVDTTPKIDGFDHAQVSKSVSPEPKEEDSPFTFIDPE